MQYNRVFNVFFCLLLTNLSYTASFAEETIPFSCPCNNFSFHIAPLFLQPSSNNLKYAVFVSGNQPYQQSWHNQTVNPGYSAAFELGADKKISPLYDISLDWLHLNTNDSDSKQASENTDIATVQFVAPPYDVGPAVFGIKRAYSKVNFDFNGVQFNLGKQFEYCPNVKIRLFGGLGLLDINQTITTTFSDYAGSPPIPGQAYGLPADPSFYFETKNASRYLGLGPDIGIHAEYEMQNGLGVLGQFSGILTAGTIKASDNFTSASARLKTLGIDPSYQDITAPNTLQVVPGFDSMLGLFYEHCWQHFYNLRVEAGYRFAYYANAISEIMPGTLVQAGEDPTIPEFATGTMAIQSTDYKNSPFSFQGPFVNFTIAL